MTRTLRGGAYRLALLFFALLPAMLQAQTAAIAPANPDAELAALNTKVESLKIQKQVDALVTQQKMLEKQQRTGPAPTTTDEQMTAAQNQMKILQIAQQIEGLKAKQAALLTPPPPVVPAQGTTAKPLSPQDAEIQRLQEQHRILLQEQQIAKLTQQNADLSAPPAPAPVKCVPQQEPNVTYKPPPKVASWACQHLGVCTDGKPTPVPLSSVCPAGTVPAAGTAQK